MPLTRRPEVSHAVDFNVCFVPEADITALRLLQQRRLDVQACLIYLRMTEPRWKTVLADQA